MKQITNGMEISFDDQTCGYFGDYHRVRLVVTARILLDLVNGLTEDERKAADKLFGPTVIYTKTLEKMGVGSADIYSVTNDLLTNFTEHSLPYIEDQAFPAQLVRSALNRRRTRIETSYASSKK